MERRKKGASVSEIGGVERKDVDNGRGEKEGEQIVMVGINMTLNAFTGWGNLAYQTFFGFLHDPFSHISPIMLAPLPPSASVPPAPYSGDIQGIYRMQNESRLAILGGRLGVPIIHSVDHERFDASSVSGPPITANPPTTQSP